MNPLRVKMATTHGEERPVPVRVETAGDLTMLLTARRFVALAAVTTALVAGTAGLLHAQEAADLAQRVDALRTAAADRDLPAVEQLAQALLAAAPGPDTADEARLLLGRTRLVLGRPDEAAAAVAPVVDRAESPWHVNALFIVASAGAAQRDWVRAADVYAARVEWAASELHAAEIAGLYREIADAAFEGATTTDDYGRTRQTPDWSTARRFYERSRAEHAVEDEAVEIAYRIGLSALESSDPAAASRELEALLRGEAGEFADDALFALGRARVAQNDAPGARTAFTELRDRFGDSELAPLALISIGETWWKAQRPAEAEAVRRAVDAWQTFLRLHPRHDAAPAVALQIGSAFEAGGLLREAAAAFEDLVTRYPDDERAPPAQDRAARALLGIQEYDAAVAAWRVILARWPDHALWASARESIAAASFRKGEDALKDERWDDATAAYTAFLAGFPAHGLAGQAQRRLGDVASKREQHEAAVTAWRLGASKYPQDAHAAVCVLSIARAYEGPLADLEKALAAYEEVVKRWPSSQSARIARGVLTQMKGRTLNVSVSRAFRTDESPTAKVTLRNVSRLRMKAYHLDAAEYVRRRGGLAGVEKVDVDVVKPDHEWDWEPADYERYRLLERDLPLPFSRPGAYIVTAADDELTATLLAIVSDVTVIAKAAPGGGLVFAFDERTSEPVGGAAVEILGSDLRGVTGADGVWRVDDKKLTRLRAIVTAKGSREGHFAYADAGAAGAQAFGYATKVFLQTDRPLYRAGQDVHLRAIVRRVHDGHYVTETKLKVRVTVTDPRGASLFDETLRTDDYGVVAADLALADDPALGTYTVSTTLDGRTFTRTFDVLAYRKPDMLAELETEQRTYLAGDQVKATASLRFAVGGVASAVPVRWTVFRGPYAFDASRHEAFAWFFRDPKRDAERRRREAAGASVHARGDGTTDREGKLEIAFPTDAVEEDRTYSLMIEAQDPSRRWITAYAQIPVTRSGVYVICRTEKKVYRPGERVRLEVTTVDALHVPLSIAGQAQLVRRRRVDQHWTEDEVATVAVETDAAGRAVADLKAPKGGEYVARFTARDARDQPAVGQAPVTVSGDAEDLEKQARLVADREFYREGDVAKVLVNVPVAPAAVLITYEGDRVLEHRVFIAHERSTTIELPLRAEHAPNVFLRMAVAKEGALYEDGDEVAVFQYLDVAVSATPGEMRPGESVEIEIRTTDQSGNPVEAAVGVDIVDTALYQLAPDTTPQIKPFFYDQRRTHAVRTASSAGPVLPTVTRPTNKDLLFEQMRRLGREKFKEMEEHVLRGRKLLEQGQAAAAREELRKALAIAPGNFEARGLMDLMERQDVLEKDREMRADRAPAAAAKPRRPRARTSNGPTTGGGSADAPFEGPGTNGVIGIGGGAGGAFGGRKGGRRNLRAGGGGRAQDKKKGDDARDALAVLSSSSKHIAYRRSSSLKNYAADASLAGAVLKLQNAQAMAPPELRQRFEDTAYSSPRVVTGPDGRATVRVEMPDNLTEWRVTARGATRGPLVGEGRTRFAVRKDVLVRVDAPRFLVDGDATTATGTVHSDLAEATRLELRISAEGDPISGDQKHETDLPPGAVLSFDAALNASTAGPGRVRAEALTPIESDAAVVPLPVLPYGLRRLDGASGVLVEEAFAELTLPERIADGTAALVVTLSPSVDVSLLESLAYTSSYPYGCVEQTVNRFLPALAARRALEKLDSPAFRKRDRLDESVRRGLASLYALQNPDGSFGWFGARRPGGGERAQGRDAEMTAYALLGMLRAERAGFKVSRRNRDQAVNAAKTLLAQGSDANRAFLLYALSHANAADAAQLNALYRKRDGLDARTAALLALTMHRTKRPGPALELVNRLEKIFVREGGDAHWESRGASSRRSARRPVWPVSPDAEPTAYALLALIATDPSNPLVDDAAAWLGRSRRGPAWRSTRDTAVAIEALAEHARLRGVERATGNVSVFVNDSEEPQVVVFGDRGSNAVDAPITITVPADRLQLGKNRIVLRREGGGQVHWSALMSAVEPPEEGKTIEAGGTLVTVERDYTEWVAPPLPGQEAVARIVPGWTVVIPDKRPKDWHGRPLSAAGTGDKVRVTLRVSSRLPIERVLVEDALPAGFEVVGQSAAGSYDREERRDDRQVFFLSKLHGSTTLSYVLQAVHPGEYTALPAMARAMYEPEIHGWSRENTLTVEREPGAAGRAPSAEEITPDERWGLALRAFAAEDWTSARDGLRSLMDDHELLGPILEEAWVRLFRVGRELDDADLIVKAHEELVDRNPRRAAQSLEDRQALASAYRTMGEHERALTILRDLVRDHFSRDLEAAEAFVSVGDPWRARLLILSALRRVPDAPWGEAHEFALARRTASMHARPADAPGGAGPLMLTETVRQLRDFQAHHAGSLLAHEAGHQTVRTLLQMGLAEDAVEEGTLFLGRHTDSPHLDDVTFLVATGHFQAGDHDRALAAARPLLTDGFPTNADPRKRAASPFRSQAIHLTAKVAHLRGELSTAVDLYRKVAKLYPDARDALDFLTRKGLELREVETAPVGTTPTLHLKRRNVAEVRLEVYAVDFMILYALRPDLSQVNRIDLSGVRPVDEWSVARRGSEDYRWSDEEVSLPRSEKGVYLVVARGDGLESSSVVLVSDLEVHVQTTDGRVRVYVTDRGSGQPAGEVYVKVGDGKTIKAQGFTDARGVFEAGAVGGSFSVVAEKDGNVALWRR